MCCSFALRVTKLLSWYLFAFLCRARSEDIRTFDGTPYDWTCEELAEHLSEGLWNENVISTITEQQINVAKFSWMTEQDLAKIFTFASNRSGALRKIAHLASSFRVFQMPYGLVRALTAALSSKPRDRPATARELLDTTMQCLMFKHTKRQKQNSPTPDDQQRHSVGDLADVQPQPSLQDVVDIMSSVADTPVPEEEAARSYYNLGLAMQKCGRMDEGLRCLQKAISYPTPPAAAFYTLGIALLQQVSACAP
jgi:hypothetical protein